MTSTDDIECSSLFKSTRVLFHYLLSTIITYASGSTSTIYGPDSSNAFVDVTSGGQVDGYGIVIQWESTDHVVLDWMASQTMSNSTAGPNASATPAPRTHHGISVGAVAGIAIGAVAGLVLLILAVWLFFRRRKQAQVNHQQDVPEHVDNSHAIIAPEKGMSCMALALEPR